MPKNIVIFSDGTGQAGGLKPDQRISNIYKLYRACRCDEGSDIDPANQVSFYDPGLGTENDQGSIPVRSIQKVRKLWSGATGSGLSRNIADCYEAILKHYEPGDRIFLFGFSRGAYTARCVGGVLSYCGVPTHAEGGGPLPRFGRALRAIADEAVQKVYEHGAGHKDDANLKLEREEQARRFRKKYGSENAEGKANVVPYFIGVFDTVAALGAPKPRRIAMGTFLIAGVAFAAYVAAIVVKLLLDVPTFYSWLTLMLGASGWMWLDWHRSHRKVILDFPKPGDVSKHTTKWKFEFYDEKLNPRVGYARHALAIDETREDFDRVKWASPLDQPQRPGGVPWLKQYWFAGNHSDIGGSYAHDESRLSDIALQWMVEQTQEPLEHKLEIDMGRLKLYPDPLGMQHCEVQAARDVFPPWWPRKLHAVWSQIRRQINVDATLHPSVLTRVAAQEVSHYGIRQPYRPANLSQHQQTASFYQPQATPAVATTHSAGGAAGSSAAPAVAPVADDEEKKSA